MDTPHPGTPAPVVAWWRAETRTRIVRIWGVGACLVATGVSLIAAARLASAPIAGIAQAALAVVGAVCTLAGPLYAVLAFKAALSEERWVALRSDGLAWSDGGREDFIAWGDLEAVEATPQGVVLQAAGTRHLVDAPLDGITHEELAARIDLSRRRALMGIPVR